MQPELKRETIVREYWSCPREEHRHKTEVAALRCVELSKPRKERKGRKWNNAAFKALARRREAGESVKTLARELLLSDGRTRWCIAKGERLLRFETKRQACPE